MKSLITTMLTIGIIVPVSSVYAMSVDEMIDNAKAGNGIYVESHASASTGGQTAAAGQSVSTGDSSASSHIETHINDGSAGGSVHVKVETTQNGTTTTEEYSKNLAPGEGVQVHVGTSAKVHAAFEATPRVFKEVSPRASTSEVTSEATPWGIVEVSGEATPWGLLKASPQTFFFFKLPDIFKHIFSFLWRF